MVAPAQSQAVVAPDSGLVAAVYPETGTLVTAGMPVVQLFDLDLTRALARDTRTTDSLLVLGQVAQAQALAASEARLEADLGLDVTWYPALVLVGPGRGGDRTGMAFAEYFDKHDGDKQAAQRRAGVRAAAEIGRAMP